MKEYMIVCVDDDEQFLGSLAASLPSRVEALCRDFRCSFEFVASGRELFELMAEASDLPPLAMVISDQIMAGMGGIELIEKVKADWPNMTSVLLTGNAGLESARYAINHHLLDQYVCKPIEDMQEFASTVSNLLKRHHLDREERQRTAQLAETNEELRRSNEKIRAMQTAAESVAKLSKKIKRLDFDEVVELIARDVPKMFNAQRGVFCLGLGQEHMDLVRRENCPCPDAALEIRTEAQKALSDGEIYLDGVPAVCQELGSQPPEVLVPLHITCGTTQDDQTASACSGYLCLCTLADGLEKSEEVLKYKAELLGEILSVSLTNASLYERAKRDSQKDALTGVYTRRVLEERLQAEYARGRRYSNPCCLLMLDVDNFKQVNDEAGHMAGDQTLRSLAEILGREIRQTDTLVRYGGDEFVVLMPETTLPEATAVAERIRQRAESELARSGRKLTVSCGVANWSGAAGETATDLLRRADAALYHAKSAGRNQVRTEQAA
jgi:diguanylate cyclase (GGDEF)-like protein